MVSPTGLRVEFLDLEIEVYLNRKKICRITVSRSGSSSNDFPDESASPGCSSIKLIKLRRYFRNKLRRKSSVDWDNLDTSSVTDFELKVYDATSDVEPGKTQCYGRVAGRLGKPGAAQAVGGALKRNPFPLVVPCHRIVRKNGVPGGYQGVESSPLKEKLLELERQLASS